MRDFNNIYSIARNIIVSVATVFSTQAIAGGENSGGGAALVCFENEAIPKSMQANGGDLTDAFIPLIKSVETYDLYEAKLSQGRYEHKPKLATIPANWDLDTFLWYVFRRMERIAPDVAFETYGDSSLFQLLPSYNIWYPKHGLRKIDDIFPKENGNANGNELLDPKCTLITMAAQKEEGSKYSLKIDGRLFNHPLFSRESQAALFLHEYTYHFARKHGQTNSENTRKMVALMLTEDSQMSVRDFIHRSFELGFLPQYSGRNLDYASSFDQEVRFAAYGFAGRALNASVTLAEIMRDYDNYNAPRIKQFAPYLDLNGLQGARTYIKNFIRKVRSSGKLPPDLKNVKALDEYLLNGLDNGVLNAPIPNLE